MKLVFCTNNQHKLQEVSQIMQGKIQFLSLRDIGYDAEIPEPYATLSENSKYKSQQVKNATGYNYCFSEDTGLFIESLNGEPGVFSARYAGENANSKENIEKVLHLLGDAPNRNAYFKTVITLLLDNETHQFEGICKGEITHQEMGEDGFGYDPIFIPMGYKQSFAQLSSEEKNTISHRGKAIALLIEYLNSHLPIRLS